MATVVSRALESAAIAMPGKQKQTQSKIQKRTDAVRLMMVAVAVTLLLVLIVALTSYAQIRHEVLKTEMNELINIIDSSLVMRGLDPLKEKDVKLVSLDFRQLMALPTVIDASYFNASGKLIWASSKVAQTNQFEHKLINKLLNNDKLRNEIIDPYHSILDIKYAFSDSDKAPITTLIAYGLKQNNNRSVLKIKHDFSSTLAGARRSAYRILWYILFGNIILFFVLFYGFRSGLQTIEKQEQALTEQVKKLSKSLATNRSLQSSMKSASSRAVELNEQFLRRVGSDLHDGPAQNLGYAILRLDQIAKRQENSQISGDFPTILKALNDSIEEIRGISSGLVMPELQELTLEEAMQRVVLRHGMISGMQVSERYSNLPKDNVPLPIKITAYRFVQEGLNNAYRHGDADKAKLTVRVSKGKLKITLKDNGSGFRQSQIKESGGHLGLLGLKDRIESLGGDFSVDSELGVGTTIRLTMDVVEDVISL